MNNRTIAAFIFALPAPGLCIAQQVDIPRWTETAWPINKTVGPLTNGAAQREVLDTVVGEVALNPLMRLKFASWNLPVGTSILITSPKSGEVASMGDRTLQDWSGFTPVFNDTVLIVELVAEPGTGPAGFTLASANEIRFVGPPLRGDPTDNICGTDDRLRGNTTAVGRLWLGNGLCTASLVASGDAAVSAGHCGAPAAGDRLEFDPPDSVFNPVTMTWEWMASAIANQFPVNAQRVSRNFTFVVAPCAPPNQAQNCIQSYGHDALAFGLNANTLGQTAGMKRGDYLRITRAPQVSTNFTATKWGNGMTDPQSANHFTMKSIDGAISGARVNLDGGVFWAYSFDTTGGDSGGPVVNQNLNASVGVTSSSGNTGCDSHAYAFSNAEFQTVVETVINQGTTRFVDHRSTSIAGETAGTIWSPSPTFRSNAYNIVPSNGTVQVAPGTYSSGSLLNRPATIRAPFGTVTLIP